MFLIVSSRLIHTWGEHSALISLSPFEALLPLKVVIRKLTGSPEALVKGTIPEPSRRGTETQNLHPWIVAGEQVRASPLWVTSGST